VREPLSALRDAARRALFWRRHERTLARLRREHPLEYLFLEVTRRCNLTCAYCGSDCVSRETKPELSIEQWLAVVRQVAADFDSRKIMVAVTGGEPLLKEGIFDLFDELRRLGFPYGIVSNGFLLTAETAKRLVRAGIGSISLSMDAPGELNDRLRGKNSSAKVTQAIAHLRQAGYSGKLEIISTITTPVVPFLEPMRRWVAEQRIPLWRVAPVMPIGRAAHRPDLVPGPREIRQILEFVREARRDSFAPRPEFSEEGFLGNRFEGVVRPYLCQCRAGITIAGILCDGKIGACPELGEAFVQGDILRERLREVWTSRYQVFRDRSWTRKNDCLDCKQYRRCGGGALHLYASPEAPLLRCLYLMAKEGGGETSSRTKIVKVKGSSPGANQG
jgi:radical SAM protein with 4Fe4S-binding SPASM domain